MFFALFHQNLLSPIIRLIRHVVSVLWHYVITNNEFKPHTLMKSREWLHWAILHITEFMAAKQLENDNQLFNIFVSAIEFFKRIDQLIIWLFCENIHH